MGVERHLDSGRLMAAWEVKLPDESWRHTDDLTGKELEAIEQSTGTPWVLLNPYRSMAQYRAIVSAFIIREGVMGDNELIEWFNGLKVNELRDGVKEATESTPDTYEDGLPKAAGEPSTGSSASSPVRPSVGPQT